MKGLIDVDDDVGGDAEHLEEGVEKVLERIGLGLDEEAEQCIY